MRYLTHQPRTSSEYLEQLTDITTYLLAILADLRRCDCPAHRTAVSAALYSAWLAAASLTLYTNHTGDTP